MLCSNLILAQDYFDPVKIGHKYTSLSEFENSDKKSSEINYTLDLTLPFKIKSSTYFITGTSYDYYVTELDTDEIAMEFHSIILKIGLSYPLSKNWNATIMGLPKLSSELNNFDLRDFQFGLAVLFKRNISPHFNYQFGAYFNQELYGPYFTPLAGIYHKSKNDRLTIHTTLPSWGEVYFKIHPMINSGIRFNSITRSYRLFDDVNLNESYLQQRSNEIKVLAQIFPAENLLIEFLVGYTIAKKYEVYNSNDKIDLGFISFLINDNRTPLNANISNSLLKEVRFIYRIHTD